MKKESYFLTLSLVQLEELTALQPQPKVMIIWSCDLDVSDDSDYLFCSAASLGVLSFGWSLSDAIEARRLHHQLYNNTVYVESESSMLVTCMCKQDTHKLTLKNSTAGCLNCLSILH